VRFWEWSGLARTDRSIRALGLAAGLATVAALWRNARNFGFGTPVVSLALLTFTNSTICFGDSIRAYGMGMFLGVLAIGCIWELTQTATAWRIAAALIAALLGVHMLFYNCVMRCDSNPTQTCHPGSTTSSGAPRWGRGFSSRRRPGSRE
jgi:hypothetical protein